MVALVSRATYYKGWDFAVRCAADLLQRQPGVQFQMVFCGAGPDLAAFRGLSEKLGVSHNLHFLGKRGDVRSVLCAADIGFHPSQGEAMSLAILEMMCAGLPVVVPNRPSVCGAVVSKVTGLIYEANDVSSAVNALVALCTNRSLRATLGHNARTAMLERHQLEETNRQFRSVVLPLLI